MHLVILSNEDNNNLKNKKCLLKYKKLIVKNFELNKNNKFG